MNNKAKTIGFATFFDYKGDIGQKIFNGVNTAAKNYNINLINFITVVRYSFSEDINNYTFYKNMLKFLNNHNIDGIISRLAFLENIMTLEEIEKFHNKLSLIPVLTLGVSVNNISSISFDQYAGIYKVIEHLFQEHGYKKIGFIGCNGYAIYQERFDAYKSILKKFNIPYNPDLVYFIDDVYSKNQIKKVIDVFFKQRKISQKKDVQAFVTVSDILAYNLIEELSNIGINVPNDLAVTGFNDQLQGLLSLPPITTIHQDFFKLGYQAVEIIISMFDENKKPEQVLVPSKLIVRQSCGCFEQGVCSIKTNNTYCNNNIKSNDLLIREIYKKVNPLHSLFNEETVTYLVENLIKDISENEPKAFMQLINKLFYKLNEQSDKNFIIMQNLISKIRNIILPKYISSKESLIALENILHKTRNMLDSINCNINLIKNEQDVKGWTLLRISADVMSKEKIEDILMSLKTHLEEFGIISISIALLDKPSPNINSTLYICAKVNNKSIDINSKIIMLENYIIPRELLLKTESSSFVFNFLNHKDLLIGFILFEINSLNIDICNSLKVILSNILFKAISKNKNINLINEKKLLIRKISNSKSENNTSKIQNTKYSYIERKGSKIIDYLINNIGEKTDVNKISRDFNMSRQTLMRKTKMLTGYTIQKLHEKLKIEKAKVLLENKDLTISEISDALGYQNQFYFSLVFKKHTDLSPAKWKKIHCR